MTSGFWFPIRFAYGYAATESYGYNAGTNVFDLSQQLELNRNTSSKTTPRLRVPSLNSKIFPDSTLSVLPTRPVPF